MRNPTFRDLYTLGGKIIIAGDKHENMLPSQVLETAIAKNCLSYEDCNVLAQKSQYMNYQSFLSDLTDCCCKNVAATLVYTYYEACTRPLNTHLLALSEYKNFSLSYYQELISKLKAYEEKVVKHDDISTIQLLCAYVRTYCAINKLNADVYLSNVYSLFYKRYGGNISALKYDIIKQMGQHKG